MNGFPRAAKAFPRFLLAFAAAGLLLGRVPPVSAAEPQLRGVWMHANFIRTRAEADRTLEILERGHFNAAFLLVWYWGGQAGFQTPLCPMLEGVQAGYDPLGYMAGQCRRRGIELHAWFVNGAYGSPEPRFLLDKHPEWLVDGDGGDRLWYDLGKPAVRKFQSDLMIGALEKYDLDGVHFDYIRYNGPAVCYCKHCQEEFAARTGLAPIDPRKRTAFPLISSLSGNPIAKPTTARVLARFADGTPAIATNELDRGRVLLFNWHALRATLPPVAETLRRTLREWNVPPNKVFVMDTVPNRDRYGRKGTAGAVEELGKLGYRAAVTPEERLDKLPAGSLVVLADVYLVPDVFAESLERFLRAGGRLLVVDGPVLSMRSASLRRVLGMAGTAKFINRMEIIEPVGASDLVPRDDVKLDLEQEKVRAQKWAEYRKAGVTELVRDVYRRAKSLKPGAQVTAAVFTPLASAENVFQDWPGWIREGIIDYVIPMAYTPDNARLAAQLAEWKTVDPRLERIVPGLGIFTRGKEGEDYAPRDIGLILAQYRLCMDAGARGTNFFALDGTAANPVLLLNEPLIGALRSGPFKTPAPAYRP